MRDPDFDRRYAAAVAELQSAGISRYSYDPPFLRMMRALGARIRPVHYQSSAVLFAVYGMSFGAIWGCFMYPIQWRAQGISLATALAMSTLAGVLFGVGMAFLITHKRKQKNLTRWEDL